MIQRKFDIIVWGATGFTGRLVVQYLIEAYGGNPKLTWAIAGRSKDKCEKIKRELIALKSEAKDLEIIIADAFDLESLQKMAAQTKVICTTVGPYSEYGHALVEACVEEGTHYCDLTGESHFVRQMIDTYHEKAQEKQLKIVHASGFDSIPSDLGVLFTQEKFKEEYGSYASEIKMMTGKMKGKLSGGTFASIISMFDRIQKDPSLRRLLGNPYALNPDLKYKGKDGRDQVNFRFDTDLQKWTAPFIMAGVNTRVVRRSHALLDFPYGHEFKYSEVMGFPKGAKGFYRASSITFGIGTFLGLILNSWMRKKIHKNFLPQPGDGPTKEERDKGYFNIYFLALDGKDKLWTRVSDTVDPGYASTAKMLAETAVSLALDVEILPKRSGVLTPASAIGNRLIERLQDVNLKFIVV